LMQKLTRKSIMNQGLSYENNPKDVVEDS